ncbi:hypothetical protein [Actinoplanes subglobosus]|uniref:Uncharacterized protein n=1 Tax=Actinoplanes subglobosus TaxID=1547892 RepID=A0ABV8IW64_9ACTN
MTLYGIKVTRIFLVSCLFQTWAAVQLFRHDGPWWLPVLLWFLLAWSLGQWRRATDDSNQLSSGAFFTMLLVPPVSAGLAVWGVVLAL